MIKQCRWCGSEILDGVYCDIDCEELWKTHKVARTGGWHNKDYLKIGRGSEGGKTDISVERWESLPHDMQELIIEQVESGRWDWSLPSEAHEAYRRRHKDSPLNQFK